MTSTEKLTRWKETNLTDKLDKSKEREHYLKKVRDTDNDGHDLNNYDYQTMDSEVYANKLTNEELLKEIKYKNFNDKMKLTLTIDLNRIKDEHWLMLAKITDKKIFPLSFKGLEVELDKWENMALLPNFLKNRGNFKHFRPTEDKNNPFELVLEKNNEK